MGRKATIKLRESGRKKNMDAICQRAEKMGIYTVESLREGIGYFYQSGDIAVITERGYMLMSVETAQTVAREILGICRDIRHLREMEVRKEE